MPRNSTSKSRCRDSAQSEAGRARALGSVPRHAEWLSPSVLCNDIIEQAVAAVLGEGCFLHLFSELTNVPGSGAQDLHMVGFSPAPHPTHFT